MAQNTMSKFVLLVLASLFVLVQTVSNYDDSFFFALMISSASLVLSVVMLSLFLSNGIDYPEPMCIVLLILWVVGTSAMTLDGPYVNTGNGYFGAWTALIVSWSLTMQFYPVLKGASDVISEGSCNLIWALSFASLVVFVQTLWNIFRSECEYHQSCGTNGESGWILICSGISLFVCGALLISAIAVRVQPYFCFVTLFLVIWWAAGFFVATFDSPYVHAGNGFFGCWVAVLVSCWLFVGTWSVKVPFVKAVPIELDVLLLASIVVLIAAAYEKRLGDLYTWWAVLSSSVSLVVTLVLIVMLGSAPGRVGSSMPGLTAFLAIWWAVGTVIMTFKSPFRATGNGYFACWVALVAAVLLCQSSSDQLRSMIGLVDMYGRGFFILALSSLALLAQVIVDVVDAGGGLHGSTVLAMFGSFATLVTCILTVVLGTKISDGYKWIALVLALLWGFLVAVLTFDAPYIHTGNGYFSCWMGFFACIFMLIRLLPATRVREATVVKQGWAVKTVQQKHVEVHSVVCVKSSSPV